MPSPLKAAATATFESLALLLPTPEPSALEAAATPAHAVRLAFDGPFRGWLALRVTDDVARALAENMLGAAEAEPALVRDALGEVANVVCGNVLPALGGRGAVFHLQAPGPLAVDDASWHAAPLTSLGVDGGRADLALHIESAVS
jgi:CheY-specific phosphatase CheX